MSKLRLLDLFSGIGGFSLGLERSEAFETVAFCEIDPFCRRVLKKHWPETPCYDDVRSLTAERLRADGISVDAICGGFPCQDISCAGSGAGIEGERSGLWSEYARLIGELRPRIVVVENVAALLGNGMGRVLGDLAALGYDAEWHGIPASAVGAHHRRDRIWIVANPRRIRHGRSLRSTHSAHHEERDTEAFERAGGAVSGEIVAGREAMADAASVGHKGQRLFEQWCSPQANGIGQAINALAGRECGAWSSEPAVGRVAHGVPNRVDRLRALGNAVVPQIPELIGKAIKRAMERAA